MPARCNPMLQGAARERAKVFRSIQWSLVAPCRGAANFCLIPVQEPPQTCKPGRANCAEQATMAGLVHSVAPLSFNVLKVTHLFRADVLQLQAHAKADFWMTSFWTFTDIPDDRVAIRTPDAGDLSYGELGIMADAWATRIAGLTGGKRAMVALEFDTTVEVIAAYLGALRAGFPVLVLEAGQIESGSRLHQVWQPEIHLRRSPTGLEVIHTPADLPEPHPDLRLLLSTSGSTGDPKLVRLSGENIDSNARSIAEYLHITPQDRAATTLPLFYSYGLSVLNSYLSAGAALVLTHHSVTEPAFWREAAAQGVTSLAMVPHQFDLLEHSGFTGAELPSLRYVTQAGGKLAPHSIRHFAQLGRSHGWDMVVMYGQTEAAPRISYVPPEALPEAAGTIGRAIPGGRLWLADEQGQEITASDVPGELFYSGPNVMMGYAVERADLARPHEVEVLQTGDIAERTADGLFRIVGRLKRFVKLYGLRLSLDQIEALLRDRGVAAQAVAVDDRLVLLHSDAVAGPRAREIVSAEYELPLSEIHTGHLEEMPLLASGKPDHKALKALAEAVLVDADQKGASLSIAEALANATRSKTVGPQDSFTSLGGDSLGYLQVQMTLESMIGRAPAGWENMPLAELESHVARLGMQASPRWGSVGVDVLLRVLGISLVVAQHASDYPLYGGTWILILLMGYSAGRFQLRQIISGHPGTIALKMFYPIVPLYLCILAAYQVMRDSVPILNALFLANYVVPQGGSYLEVLWFVSLYVQLVTLLILTAWIRPVRRALAKDPWRVVMIALAGSILLLGLIMLLFPVHPEGMGRLAHLSIVDFPAPHPARRGFLECLSIFLLGWALMAANTRVRQLLSLCAVLPVIALFLLLDTDPIPAFWLSASAIALLWGFEAPLPTSLALVIKRVAAASLFIYLTHLAVVFVLRWGTGIEGRIGQPTTTLVALIGSFALGVGLKAVFDLLDQKIQSISTQDVRFPHREKDRRA